MLFRKSIVVIKNSTNCLPRVSANKFYYLSSRQCSSSSIPPDSTPDEEKPKLTDAERQAMYDRMIRVNHAGEMGAGRIYAGQLAVLGRTKTAPMLKHMAEQEKVHLDIFERLITKHDVRPTALAPLWHLAGYALGAGSALLGKEGAMACTVAVEETIAEHYNDQIRTLYEDNPEKNKELLDLITKCRDEEVEHHDIGLEEDAEKAPFFPVLKSVIQVGCKGAIFISERI